MFALCDRLIQKNKFKPYKKLFGNYSFSCFDEIDNIPIDQWKEAIKDENHFYHIPI